MIPGHILQYLNQEGVDFERLSHARAVSATELAQTLHVTGRRVAKAVIVEASGRCVLCVLPATEWIDLRRLASELDTPNIRFVPESEFHAMFRDCEVGAEPPFGSLYGMPVIVDRALAREPEIVFRAGSHEEAIQMTYADFARLERPKVIPIGRQTN
jgi:Ala-tRNA(Pro) deacylase